MPRRQDAWSQIGDELAEWIESVSDALVDALIGNGPAPFSASLNRAEKLEFYRRAFFNPDGSPNFEGRAQQMQRLGPGGYATVLRALLGERAGQPARREQPALSYPGAAA